MNKFVQTDSELFLDGQRFTLHTVSSLNPDPVAIEKAHASFVKHAPEIFGEDPTNPTLNPETGKTVFADIETLAIWDKLIKGHTSKAGHTHHGIAAVVCDEKGEPVAFQFTLYHVASNTVNDVYEGVDDAFRKKGLQTFMEKAVDKELGRVVQHEGFKACAARLVECVRGEDEAAVKVNAFHEHHGLKLAPFNWKTPLLIANGKGGHDEQDMCLRVKFADGLNNAQQAETLARFIKDYYALYTGLYDTPSLGVRRPKENAALLKDMEKEFRANLGVPAKATRRTGKAPLHEKKL